MTDRVLEGLRVLDLGHHVAGPLVGQLLADHGADVLRVLSPRYPVDPRQASDRGKRLLRLDLRHPDDQARLRELVRGADVLIENSRPDSLRAKGLSPDDLLAVNPQLIVCSLPGFPHDHPLADRPAWEGTVGTEAGLYEVPDQRDPRYTEIPVASVTAALYGANGILAALLARERDGLGQHVSTSLYEAVFAVQELAAMLAVKPPPAWSSLKWAGTPFMGHYTCSDGRTVYLHLGLSRHLERFLDLVEREHLVEDLRAWRSHLSPATRATPTEPASLREAVWFHRRLRALLATRSARQWEDILGQQGGLCCVMCRTTEEWLAHPQALAVGDVVESVTETYGPLRQPGVVPRLSRTPGAPGAPPVELDAPPAWSPLPERSERPSRRPALDGVRVLDLSRVIAGPAAARTLAELGADVLKIEDPAFDPPWQGAFRLAWDRGKRSVLLDLSEQEGRDAFWAVVEWFRPDVVLHNFRPGVAERMGLGEDGFRERLPSVVFTAVSAYGVTGPWGRLPGWEQTAQATTGVQLRYGVDRPELLPVPVTDLATGLTAALGTLLALYHRDRGGEPQRVDATLTATSMVAQGHILHRLEAASTLGSRPLHRFYRLRGGWAFLAATPDAGAELARVRGLRGLDTTPQPGLFLEDRLRRATLKTWRARIAEAGLQGRVDLRARRDLADALNDPWAAGMGQVVRREHPGIGTVTETRCPLRLSRTPVLDLDDAAPRGLHTAEVLDRAEADEHEAPELPGPVLSRSRARWLLSQARWGAWVVLRRRRGG